MLALYDTAHNKLCGLENYSDYYIEKAIGSGSTPIVLDQLHFKYPLEDPSSSLIDYECYISNGDAEFVVKEINLQTADGSASGPTWAEFVCDANIEPIQGTRIDNFNPGSAQAEDAANLALAGTGWVVGYCDVTKTRTVAQLTQTTVWAALNAIASMYNCDVTFDTINKYVIIHQKVGTDRGAYFAEQLNLKTLQIQGNSRSIVTRLYPRGKDGMTIASVNNGVEYVSNYQYMTKVVEAYWIDNRYTVAADMLADADERLDFLSKPLRAYSAAIIDIANASGGKYSLLVYDIGDTIMLLAESVGVREQQRIVKIDQYPDEPERSTCEIANRIVSLDDIILRVSDAADTISDATDGDGNVLGSSVSVTNKDGTFDPLNVALEKVGTLIAGKIDATTVETYYLTANQISSTYATITYLTTNYLTADSISSTYLTAQNAALTYATIQNLTANYLTAQNAAITYATIDNLNTANGNIANLQSGNATIVNLLSNNAGIDSLSSDSVQAAYAALATASLGDAQIASLSVAKLLAGTISTTKFTLSSDSGNLVMMDNTIQFKDANRVRIQIGKDASNDYNLYLWDSFGNLMWNAEGLKADAIKDKIIRDDMVADDAAINGGKIDMESLASAINGSTITLNTSRFVYDPTGQSLNVAFNNVSTTANTASTNASNAVSTANTAASNASSAVSTANSASSTASSAASNASSAVSTANTASTNASAAVSTANSASSTASSALSTANSAQSAVTALSQTVTSQGTSISTMQGQISTKIWQTDITTAVNGIQNGLNLVLNSDFSQGTVPGSSVAPTGWTFWGGAIVFGGQGTTGYNLARTIYVGHQTSDSGIFQTLYLSVSTTYTISFSASKENVSRAYFNVEYWDANGNIIGYYGCPYDFGNPNTIQHFTFTTPASFDHVTFSCGGIAAQWGVNYLTTVGNVKLETGSTPTVWSANPQDVQGQISTINTTINSQQSSLTQLQSSIDACVTSSTFTSYTSSNDSNISSLQSRMSSAEQKITDTAIVSTVTSSTSWSNLNSTANTASSTATNALNTANSKSRNFTSTPTVPYYVGDTWTNPSGDVKVCNTARATGSYTASDWGYASSVTTSTITQLSDSINLKVNANGVIAAINVSPETATIDAANINLNGLVTAMNNGSYTKINGGAIDTTTLSSAKITTSGSTVYGTIGDISSDGKTGFKLCNSSGNLLRIASGPYGDDGAPATIMDVNGSLTIKSDINNAQGAYMFLFDDFEARTNSGASFTVTQTTGCIQLFDTSNVLRNYWFGSLPGLPNATYDGSNAGTVAIIRKDGVAELGKYADFHATANSTSDYDVRLTANSDGTTSFSGGIYAGNYAFLTTSGTTVLLRNSYNVAGSVVVISAPSGLNVTNYANSAFAPVNASAFNNGSTIESKDNIQPIDFDCLSAVESSDICSFEYKSEPAGTRYGLIIGGGYTTPSQVLSDDGCAVNMYSMVSVAWQAIKQLSGSTSTAIEQLESENTALRTTVDYLYGENAMLKNQIFDLQNRISVLEEKVA